jgi:hypothetical protein
VYTLGVWRWRALQSLTIQHTTGSENQLGGWDGFAGLYGNGLNAEVDGGHIIKEGFSGSFYSVKSSLFFL